MKNPKIMIKTTIALAMAGMLTLPTSAVVKENNSDPLSSDSSWVGGVQPGPSDNATWEATVLGANTVNLGADLTWSQLQIQNPGGKVTINGANTLTLSASDPFATGNTVDLEINTPLNLTGFTGNKTLFGPATGTKFTLNGALSFDPAVTRISFNTGGGNAGTWELGGISSFTNEVQLGGSGNRLGIGASSTASGGPLGTGKYIVSGGSATIYTYAYGGNQTISNAVELGATAYFSGANDLTFANQTALAASGAATRGVQNLGTGTVTLANGFFNGALQVLAGKFALGGVSSDATGSGTSGNTKVQNTGAELILLSGGSTTNRIRAHGSGTLTVKPTVANGVFTARWIQADSNPTKPTLAFDFTAVAPSTTTAPLNAPTQKSEIFNATDVIIRGNAASFPLTVIPLFQYAPSTTLQMANLPPNGGATLVLPPGLEGTLTDSTVFPNTLELTVTCNNCTPLPPVITVQPQPQGVPQGANATFSVTALGGTPNLAYQWYDPANNPISYGTNASVTITNVQLANVGDYYVVVTNNFGSTPSSPAALSLLSPYTLPDAVFWTGRSNQLASDLENYGTNSFGQGNPVSTLAGKVLEYSAQYNVATLNMTAAAITLGAFHSNTNRGAGTGYNMSGSGPWTITKATVESAIGTIPNAAVIMDHPGGGGWRISPNIILDGGGEFVFSWNNDNWGEIAGAISEANGAADLVFTGNGTPLMVAGGALTTSGKITITNSTDLTFRYDFDISGGPGSGELVIYNDASHFDLRNSGGPSGGISNYFKVKTLTCVGGAPVPAGVYTYDDLVTLGNGSYFYGNFGAGDKLEVTVGPSVPQLTIASYSQSGSTLTLNLANGTPSGPFDLLQATTVDFSTFTTNQSGTFDGSGAQSVNVTIGSGNAFFRAREIVP